MLEKKQAYLFGRSVLLAVTGDPELHHGIIPKKTWIL